MIISKVRGDFDCLSSLLKVKPSSTSYDDSSVGSRQNMKEVSPNPTFLDLAIKESNPVAMSLPLVSCPTLTKTRNLKSPTLCLFLMQIPPSTMSELFIFCTSLSSLSFSIFPGQYSSSLLLKGINRTSAFSSLKGLHSRMTVEVQTLIRGTMSFTFQGNRQLVFGLFDGLITEADGQISETDGLITEADGSSWRKVSSFQQWLMVLSGQKLQISSEEPYFSSFSTIQRTSSKDP